MGRLFIPFILAACLTLSANAAKKVSPIAKLNNITFYGVDFSQGKIFGSTDTPDKLRKAYADINMLFITEPNKYDIAKLLGKDVKDVRIEAVSESNEDIDDDYLKTFSSSFTINDENLVNSLKNLEIENGSGVGFVMVMQQLNKPAEEGTYQLVFFDIDTRNIITRWTMRGKAGGIGLRNFWAKSVLEVLKQVKGYKE